MKMQCVILAGGLATRLRPITDDTPKALIPIGKKPFIDYQMSKLSLEGITDVVLCVGYLGEKIKHYVSDGSKWGLKVSYVDEGTQLMGTAGALRKAYDAGVLAERFFVLYGDSYLPVSFREIWDDFRDADYSALMTVFKNKGQWDQSNVCFDQGTISLYQKSLKTKPEGMDYIDYGLSIFSKNTIEENIAPREKMDLADVFHRLSKAKKLQGFQVHERFFEIGSVKGVEDFTQYVFENRLL